MLHDIGLTDYYFKELLSKNPDYLLLLINGICNLKLTKEDITVGNTEERDSITFKTIMYDIKVVSSNTTIDIEAQKRLNNSKLNEYGDYEEDINRGIYYLSMLHSRSYEYKEKGYRKKRSIVIFLYLYDIAGDYIIQKINYHNVNRNIEYDNTIFYMVSLAKIHKNSRIELERALKLLTEINVEDYMNDSSKIIKEAAIMLKDYDETEIAIMKRDAKRREEYERGIELEAATEKGIAEGIAKGRTEGIAKGRAEGMNNSIITMSKNGFDNEAIAKALSLDINYVNEVLK